MEKGLTDLMCRLKDATTSREKKSLVESLLMSCKSVGYHLIIKEFTNARGLQVKLHTHTHADRSTVLYISN